MRQGLAAGAPPRPCDLERVAPPRVDEARSCRRRRRVGPMSGPGPVVRRTGAPPRVGYAPQVGGAAAVRRVDRDQAVGGEHRRIREHFRRIGEWPARRAAGRPGPARSRRRCRRCRARSRARGRRAPTPARAETDRRCRTPARPARCEPSALDDRQLRSLRRRPPQKRQLPPVGGPRRAGGRRESTRCASPPSAGTMRISGTPSADSRRVNSDPLTVRREPRRRSRGPRRSSA